MTRVAVALATAGGAGYAPIAPGTAGSAVGVVVYLLTRQWPLAWQLSLLLAIVAAGTWAASVTARAVGRDDPGLVVIDEVAGQLVTLLATGASIGGAIAGFFVFRLFDIVKPWPARRLESLHGGPGIMADDLMAGIYGHLVLRALIWAAPAWLT